MKNKLIMKKLFLVSIMLVAIVTFVTAQQRQRLSTEERVKNQIERLEKLLSLTADQKTKIEAIEFDLAKQMEKLMQDNQGNREGMRTAMQEIDKTRDAKYKEVLSADQLKTYLKDKEERRKEMEERRQQRN